jgi:hypothetical protein
LNLTDESNPFAWHHVINLRRDASDNAFDASLFHALPEVQTVPVMICDTSGIFKAMAPHWRDLRTVANALLTRQQLGESVEFAVRPHRLFTLS